MTTLQWIIDNKSILNINQIEKDLGMAQGILSKAIGGRQKLPKKWEKVLDQYFGKIISDYLKINNQGLG